MKKSSVWSRSRLFLPGAGAVPIWSDPESTPGPRTSGDGAAQKSGSSATLPLTRVVQSRAVDPDPHLFSLLIRIHI